MSRYHVIDTKSGEIVREQSRLTPYRRPGYRTWTEWLLGTTEGNIILATTLGVIAGWTLGIVQF